MGVLRVYVLILRLLKITFLNKGLKGFFNFRNEVSRYPEDVSTCLH